MSALSKNRKFTLAAFLTAGVFWVIDSSIHYFIYKEPSFEIIPSEANELWMRVIIVGIVILIGGLTDKYRFKAQSVQKDYEKILGHKRRLEDIDSEISNLLTSQNMFRISSMEKSVVDEDMNTLYDKAIDEKLDETVTILDSVLVMENITNKKESTSASGRQQPLRPYTTDQGQVLQ